MCQYSTLLSLTAKMWHIAFQKKTFQNLFHVDDALGIFEKLTIVPESESITDDIMRYNLLFSIQETTLYIHIK